MPFGLHDTQVMFLEGLLIEQGPLSQEWLQKPSRSRRTASGVVFVLFEKKNCWL
jgi:hypothetical protein